MGVKKEDEPITAGILDQILDQRLQSVRDELRQELQEVRKDAAIANMRTNIRIDQLGEDLRVEMREMSSRIIGHIDGCLGQIGKIDRAQVIADWRMREMEQRVSALEQRRIS